MRWAVLILSAGCNPFFGIEDTATIDAAPMIDAAVIPAATCPDPGTGGVPRFRTELNQVAGARKCVGYAVNTAQDFALAVCDIDGAHKLASGPVNDGISPQLMVPDPQYVYQARLAPGGTAAFIQIYDSNGGSYPVQQYARTEQGWAAVGMPWDFGTSDFSNTTTDDRIVVIAQDQNLIRSVIDLQLVDGKWIESRAVPVSEYLIPEMMNDLVEPSLSPDGLRLVVTARLSDAWVGLGGGGTPIYGNSSSALMYMDRASVDDKFSAPRLIDTVPGGITSAHLTADCSRLYFSALDTVWYVEYAYE